MIHAYDDMYLDDAMRNLGEAFDYAANACRLDLDEFVSFFVSSKVAKLFGEGTPRFVCGLSGTELVMYVLDKVKYPIEYPKAQISYDYTSQFWAGWIFAYCQWSLNITFKELHSYISMDNLLDMYYPLHEASEDKTVQIIANIISNKMQGTRLQNHRKMLCMSQSQLAQKSGVNLRTLQQYETRAKDINKASISSVYALSEALQCEVSDIVEFNASWYGK